MGPMVMTINQQRQPVLIRLVSSMGHLCKPGPADRVLSPCKPLLPLWRLHAAAPLALKPEPGRMLPFHLQCKITHPRVR